MFLITRLWVLGIVGLLLAVGVANGQSETTKFEVVAELAGPAELVHVQRERVYVAGGHSFTAFDVSDPFNPKEVSSYTFPEEIWGFRLTDDRAYIGANFFGLGILDISHPEQLTLIGQHKTLGQTKIGAVVDSKVGIIDHMEGFVLVDITDETVPASIGSFFLDGYARDVVTAGAMAYATDSPSGLYVFDLTRPGMPEPVGVVHAPNAPRDIDVIPGSVDRPTLLVGAGGGNVQIYDVSDPSAPVKLSAVETPGRASRVSVYEDYVFVADSESGIQIVDLSSPDAPMLLDSVETSRPVRDISAWGQLVAAVVGDSEREGDDRDVLILQRTP